MIWLLWLALLLCYLAASAYVCDRLDRRTAAKVISAREAYERLKRDFPVLGSTRIIVAVRFPRAPALNEERISALFDFGQRLEVMPHVTTVDSIVNADTIGFQPLLAGTSTGAIYGDGTYFGRDASYSDIFAGVLPTGQKCLIAAYVVVGRWAPGRSGMKSCPLLPGESFRRYNSLVDNVDNPSMFVIQEPGQAYPAYLITYH